MYKNPYPERIFVFDVLSTVDMFMYGFVIIRRHFSQKYLETVDSNVTYFVGGQVFTYLKNA